MVLHKGIRSHGSSSIGCVIACLGIQCYGLWFKVEGLGEDGVGFRGLCGLSFIVVSGFRAVWFKVRRPCAGDQREPWAFAAKLRGLGFRVQGLGSAVECTRRTEL